jgi:hypothetical protein
MSVLAGRIAGIEVVGQWQEKAARDGKRISQFSQVLFTSHMAVS